ncbi:hypothetical protein KKI24_29835 [bacterium]|nr:hypothetical protein [bacterium]
MKTIFGRAPRNIGFLAVILTLFLALVASTAIAEENDGTYTGSMTSSDCGTGTLTVTLLNRNLTGTLVHSGTTYTLTGAMQNSTGTGIDFYETSSIFFFVGNASNGIISGTYITQNGTACNGASFSLNRTSTTATADIINTQSFNAVQELAARKAVTDKIVNEVFVESQPRLVPGTMDLTPSLTATSRYKYVNIPLSYAYSENLKFAGQIPVVYVDETFYNGDVSVQGTLYTGSLDEGQLVLTTVELGLPTGSKKIGGGGFRVQAGQARVMDLEENRLFYSYSYMYTSEVDKLDTGNILNLAGGIDFPLINFFSFLQSDKGYTIATGQMITEGEYDGTGLNDDRILLDLTLGLIWRKWDLRGGISIPIMTISDRFNNSDRLVSLDVGFRWGVK